MEKKKTKKKPRRQYYIVNVPKDDLKFFEDLRISKSSFISQACLSFLELIKREGKMSLYFRTNDVVQNTTLNITQNVVKKNNVIQNNDKKF